MEYFLLYADPKNPRMRPVTRLLIGIAVGLPLGALILLIGGARLGWFEEAPMWEVRSEAVAVVQRYEHELQHPTASIVVHPNDRPGTVIAVHPNDHPGTVVFTEGQTGEVPTLPSSHLKAPPPVFGTSGVCDARCDAFEREVGIPVGTNPDYAVVLSAGDPSAYECKVVPQEGQFKGIPMGDRHLNTTDARLVDLRQHTVVATKSFLEPCEPHDQSIESQYGTWMREILGAPPRMKVDLNQFPKHSE